MNKQIILNCKAYINDNLEEECKQYILYILDSQKSNTDYKLGYEYIFQQVYIHACLKQKETLASWFKTEIYEKYFDVIQQTALRQMFIYGHYLLRKGKGINVSASASVNV